MNKIFQSTEINHEHVINSNLDFEYKFVEIGHIWNLLYFGTQVVKNVQFFKNSSQINPIHSYHKFVNYHFLLAFWNSSMCCFECQMSERTSLLWENQLVLKSTKFEYEQHNTWAIRLNLYPKSKLDFITISWFISVVWKILSIA